MNLFDDTSSDLRWAGDSVLPLQLVGYENRLQQLKAECLAMEPSVRQLEPRLTRPRRVSTLRRPLRFG